MLELSVQTSPLRYAGGKTRGAQEIISFIPSDCTEICSPFLGGGAVEILCAGKGMKVHAYDNFAPLVEFWECLLQDAVKLAERVREFYPLSRDMFYATQKKLHKMNPKYRKAAAFFAINRASFSGITMSGGMSPGHPRFTESSIERLEHFRAPNLNVEFADFIDSIPLHDETVTLYLDPPYMTEQGLYGTRGDLHRNFNHKKLAEILHERDNWVLSYNNIEAIQNMYAGYYFHYPIWKYGMTKDKTSNEVLIISNDLAPKS